MPATMTVHERLQAFLQQRPLDRLPMIEWATWWTLTIDRWHGEGLPASITDRYDLYRHFGLDDWRQFWIAGRGPDLPKAKSHGQGIVSSLDDYLRIRPHLFPDQDFGHLQSWSDLQQRGDCGIWFTMEGFFWFPRTLLGIEEHLYAFYDQPELMHRINQDLADWMRRTIDRLCAVCRPDFMTFAEDMSYNHGPMLSEALFDTFLLPYYRQVIPYLRERGIMPIIDSDGDITIAADWFRRAGLAGILPLERQAGVSVEVLQHQYPELLWIGHYDKMVMPHGEAAMRAEFERLLPAARKGTLAISVDHQTPPGVSYQQYLTYLTLFREYAHRI